MLHYKYVFDAQITVSLHVVLDVKMGLQFNFHSFSDLSSFLNQQGHASLFS